MQDEQLNFEAATGVVENSGALQSAKLFSDNIAIGLSGGAIVLAVVMAHIVAGKFSGRARSENTNFNEPIRSHWHLLSFLVSTFLILNLLFGGLTALLLGRTSEDARAYFSEISAFKLAKLSHEHFFGYGISFGVLAALSFFFVSFARRRVILPVILMFIFGGLDIASWWLARFVSYGFHNLSYATGMLFALSFCALYFQLIIVHFKYFMTHWKRK